MPGAPIIEIREPGRPVRRVVVDRAIEVGRECDGEVLSDEGVSRRHLRLVPSPVALSVVDLGSRNGTLLNGVPITGRAVLEPGAVVRLGSTEIIMIGRADRVEPAVARRTLRAGAAAALVIPPPPAAPEVARPPSSVSRFWAQLLGTAPRRGEPLFPAYTEMRRRLPLKAWHTIRIASVLAYLALCITLFIRPAGGQFWFFKVIVPLLPILFFTAPGLWRNICPLAASNQAPRWFSFTRAFTPPDWLRRYGALISIVLFFGITSTRIAFFNSNGAGLSVLLLVTIIGAFITGIAFKGKSGWCSSTCPLLPLQRVYGQTPFVKVPNSHCQPCVGCTKNCYDFRPSAAYQADLHEPDPNWTAPRKLFVSALPGYVLGFFLLVNHPGIALPEVYLRLAAFFVGSVGLFYALQALLGLSLTVIIAIWASAAINIFYWFSGITLSDSFATITGIQVPWLRWPIRAIVLVLSLFWIARTYVKGRQYEEEAASRPALPVIQISPRAAKVAQVAGGFRDRGEPDDVADHHDHVGDADLPDGLQLRGRAGRAGARPGREPPGPELQFRAAQADPVTRLDPDRDGPLDPLPVEPGPVRAVVGQPGLVKLEVQPQLQVRPRDSRVVDQQPVPLVDADALPADHQPVVHGSRPLRGAVRREDDGGGQGAGDAGGGLVGARLTVHRRVR